MNTRTVGSVMTRNVVTARPDTSFKDLVATLTDERVSALPVVVDGGRLVGIVSRRDLLSTYLRADDDIRAEVGGDVLQRVLLTDPAAVEVAVEVAVDDGVVTLTGTVDRRSTADVAGRLARAVSGVVDVVALLDWQYDDSAELKRHHVFNAQVGPTVRWPD